MNKLWLILTFGLMFGMGAVFAVLFAVMLWSGGEVILYEYRSWLLAIELTVAVLAVMLAIAGAIRYGRMERDR